MHSMRKIYYTRQGGCSSCCYCSHCSFHHGTTAAAATAASVAAAVPVVEAVAAPPAAAAAAPANPVAAATASPALANVVPAGNCIFPTAAARNCGDYCDCGCLLCHCYPCPTRCCDLRGASVVCDCCCCPLLLLSLLLLLLLLPPPPPPPPPSPSPLLPSPSPCRQPRRPRCCSLKATDDMLDSLVWHIDGLRWTLVLRGIDNGHRLPHIMSYGADRLARCEAKLAWCGTN